MKALKILFIIGGLALSMGLVSQKASAGLSVEILGPRLVFGSSSYVTVAVGPRHTLNDAILIAGRHCRGYGYYAVPSSSRWSMKYGSRRNLKFYCKRAQPDWLVRRPPVYYRTYYTHHPVHRIHPKYKNKHHRFVKQKKNHRTKYRYYKPRGKRYKSHSPKSTKRNLVGWWGRN